MVGVSTDSAKRLSAFRKANHLPFHFISDRRRALIRLYDVQRRWRLGTSRCTYVIGRDGVIWAAFHHELHVGRHVRDALHALHERQGGG